MSYSAYLRQGNEPKKEIQFYFGCFNGGVATFWTSKDGCGWIDTESKLTFSKYRTDFDFGCGLLPQPFLEQKEGEFKFGYVDKNFNYVINKGYDDAKIFCDGLAAVTDKGKSGFIDSTGKEVILLRYDSVVDGFFNGYSRVTVRENNRDKWGCIDKTGKEVIPIKYDYLDSNGLTATAKLDKTWFILDMEGRCLGSFEGDYTSVSYFDDGLAMAMKFEGMTKVSETQYDAIQHYGFIDTTGKATIPLNYDCAWAFRHGLAVVEKDHKVGLINIKKEYVLPLEYDLIQRDSAGEIFAYVGHDIFFFDKDMNRTLSTTFDYLNTYELQRKKLIFSEDLLAICKGGKWGYIDRTGKEIIPFTYDYAAPFSEGYALVYNKDRFEVIENPISE